MKLSLRASYIKQVAHDLGMEIKIVSFYNRKKNHRYYICKLLDGKHFEGSYVEGLSRISPSFAVLRMYAHCKHEYMSDGYEGPWTVPRLRSEVDRREIESRTQISAHPTTRRL